MRRKYYCEICKRNHYYDTRIGIVHSLIFQEMYEQIASYYERLIYLLEDLEYKRTLKWVKQLHKIVISPPYSWFTWKYIHDIIWFMGESLDSEMGNDFRCHNEKKGMLAEIIIHPSLITTAFHIFTGKPYRIEVTSKRLEISKNNINLLHRTLQKISKRRLKRDIEGFSFLVLYEYILMFELTKELLKKTITSSLSLTLNDNSEDDEIKIRDIINYYLYSFLSYDQILITRKEKERNYCYNFVVDTQEIRNALAHAWFEYNESYDELTLHLKRFGCIKINRGELIKRINYLHAVGRLPFLLNVYLLYIDRVRYLVRKIISLNEPYKT